MIIGFTGHRDKVVHPSELYAIHKRYPGAVWVHGGAVGFDSQVEDFAQAHGIETRILRPDYKHENPKTAPLTRNRLIADMCNLLVACYDGRGFGGTLYTIQYAKSKGRAVEVIEPKEVTA